MGNLQLFLQGECFCESTGQKHLLLISGKTRLIYIWGIDDKKRHPKMQNLVKKISKDLVRRRVESSNSLTSEVYSSLVD